MQKHTPIPDFAEITPSAKISRESHGWRAKCMQRLIRLDMPVPLTVALPATAEVWAEGCVVMVGAPVAVCASTCARRAAATPARAGSVKNV